jgi:hypothetical protein
LPSARRKHSQIVTTVIGEACRHRATNLRHLPRFGRFDWPGLSPASAADERHPISMSRRSD